MQTTTTIPNAPLPAGAQWEGNWHTDEPLAYRVITTTNRHVDGHPLELWLTARQFADGTIDTSTRNRRR